MNPQRLFALLLSASCGTTIYCNASSSGPNTKYPVAWASPTSTTSASPGPAGPSAVLITFTNKHYHRIEWVWSFGTYRTLWPHPQPAGYPRYDNGILNIGGSKTFHLGSGEGGNVQFGFSNESVPIEANITHPHDWFEGRSSAVHASLASWDQRRASPDKELFWNHNGSTRVPSLAVSYAAGFTVPITCSYKGTRGTDTDKDPVVAGCGYNLWAASETGGPCQYPNNPWGICPNNITGLKIGDAPKFFTPCDRGILTHPNDEYT